MAALNLPEDREDRLIEDVRRVAQAFVDRAWGLDCAGLAIQESVSAKFAAEGGKLLEFEGSGLRSEFEQTNGENETTDDISKADDD